MSLPLSCEVEAVLRKAGELAEASHRTVSTADVLLAMFDVPNRASKLLADRAVTVEELRRGMARLDGEDDRLVEQVHQRSRRLARGARSEAVTSLHLLAALTRESASHAYALLEACGVDIGAMRTAVMSYATYSLPAAHRRSDNEEETSPKSSSAGTSKRTGNGERRRRNSIGFHPSLQVGRRSNRRPGAESLDPGTATPSSNAPKSGSSGSGGDVRSRGHRRADRSGGFGTVDAGTGSEIPNDGDERAKRSNRLERDGSGSSEESSSRRSGAEPGADANTRLDLDAHPGINRGGRPRQRVPEEPPPEEPVDEEPPKESTDDVDGGRRRQTRALEEAQKTTRDLAERLFSDSGGDGDSPVPAEEPADGQLDAADLAADYELDPDEYPNLVEYGRNLTAQAARGNVDAVIGRDEEIGTLIDVLGKRRANNPLLVGAAGVGKTAIVEGLARRLVEMKQQQMAAGDRTIIELEMGRLLSGTHLRGAFSERLLGIKDEVAGADGDVIVFLDEIHMWMSAGSGGDGRDAAGELKTALARGRFPCVGATTHDESREFVESDPAFERRFEQIHVDEPDEETALRIVEGIRPHYERHHGVTYTPEALAAAVRLSVRYIHDRKLPDKAIGVLDLAGSRAARRGDDCVDRKTLATVVADMASIPSDRLTGGDGDRFLEMESFLAEGIVGHDEVVTSIAELLRRNYAGFRGERPIGSLLFVGPTGVGKTEMVKVLADFLFHDRDAVVQIDMSEFMESHSVSRLVGAPPGYVGHDQGGQLTERVRQRPYQVVLLDEIEKAHPDVLNLLLQLFEEGQLTDGRGREVDFSNALVVMTSNLGAEVFEESRRIEASPSIGFSRRDESGGSGRRDDGDELRDQSLEVARQHFAPELWNRIDEKLVFMPLSRDEVAEIAKLQLADSQQKLFEESDITLDYESGVVEHLIENGGYDPDYGARPMRQTIERLVEAAVAREILSGRIQEGGRAVVTVEGGEIVVRSR